MNIAQQKTEDIGQNPSRFFFLISRNLLSFFAVNFLIVPSSHLHKHQKHSPEKTTHTWWLIPRIVSGLVHPSYKWINPLLIPCKSLSHQVSREEKTILNFNDIWLLPQFGCSPHRRNWFGTLSYSIRQSIDETTYQKNQLLLVDECR